jgi:hypothetical protein
MSIMITLAQKGKFRGVFTQRKILWGILEKFEGGETSVQLNPIESLLIQNDNGRIESTTGSGKKYVKCTYGNLCGCMRDNPKIALHKVDTFEPVYAIWQSEPNDIIGE